MLDLVGFWPLPWVAIRIPSWNLNTFVTELLLAKITFRSFPNTILMNVEDNSPGPKYKLKSSWLFSPRNWFHIPVFQDSKQFWWQFVHAKIWCDQTIFFGKVNEALHLFNARWNLMSSQLLYISPGNTKAEAAVDLGRLWCLIPLCPRSKVTSEWLCRPRTTDNQPENDWPIDISVAFFSFQNSHSWRAHQALSWSYLHNQTVCAIHKRKERTKTHLCRGTWRCLCSQCGCPGVSQSGTRGWASGRTSSAASGSWWCCRTTRSSTWRARSPRAAPGRGKTSGNLYICN